MQKRVEAIIKEISQTQGLPEDVVTAIVNSQFQCAREATKKGESGNPSTFLNIRFKHLGILVAKRHKIVHAHKTEEGKDS